MQFSVCRAWRQVSPHQQQNQGEVPSLGKAQPPTCFSLTAERCVIVWSQPQQETWHWGDSRLGRLRGWGKNCKTLHQSFFLCFIFHSLSENEKRMCSLWFPLHSRIRALSPSYLFCLMSQAATSQLCLPGSTSDKLECSGTPPLDERVSCGPVH